MAFNPDIELAENIELTKIWMRWVIERPDRKDIIECASHLKKKLLKEDGIIITEAGLSKPKEKIMSVYVQTKRSLWRMVLDGITKEKAIEDIMKKIQDGIINETDEAKQACSDFMNQEILLYSRYEGD